jgi:hypothetical protein
MPAITSVRWVRRFQLGSYRILVGTDCDSGFGGKHFNMGSSPDYTDLLFFTKKALEAIIDPLGMSASETPKELPLD